MNQTNMTPERPMQTAQTETKEKTNGTIPHSIHIDGYYKGFHVEVIQTDPKEMEATYQLIKNAKAIVDLMEKDGWMPSWNVQTNKQLEAVKDPDPSWIRERQINEPEKKEAPTEAVPVCPYHNKPMTQRQGQYGMFWSCSTKLDNGEWCKYKPNKKKSLNEEI